MQIRVFTLLFIFICLFACDWSSQRKRPFGYLRLGKIQQFQQAEVFIPELRLYLRYDQGGYSAMSTMCTYDLSDLKKITTSDGFIWSSDFSSSTYSADGSVLTGPARAQLPYYKITLDYMDIEDMKKGPPDTVYVTIGAEVDKNWRIAVQLENS